MTATLVRHFAGWCLAGLFMASCTVPAANDEVAAAIAFRDRVMVVLAREFPERQFASTDDPDLLTLGEAQLSLQSLRAKFFAAGEPADELDAMVKAHFDVVVATVASVTGAPPTTDWSSVQALVRPQLAPAEFLERMPLAHAPFARGLVRAFVIDRPDSYQYVLADDLARWGVTMEQLHDTAVNNLNEASKDISIAKVRGLDKLLLIETQDGYDAARLLVPRFRAFTAEHLGSPFYAAVPNRDLLIMWSISSSAEFQAKTRQKVAEAFGHQPYPMSESVFEATAEAVTELDL